MKAILCAAVVVSLLASVTVIAAKHHHHKKHHPTFSERFSGIRSQSLLVDRFSASRPDIRPGLIRRYPGMYFGSTYLGDDPDINVRFELRRDYARGQGG